MASSKRLLRLLPPELIEEILNRTPAASLNRFKWACKQWYDLITDKRFIYSHLDHSPQRFIKIDDHKTVQIMDPVTGIHKDSPVPDVFCNSHMIDSMVHCDGLMLCFSSGPVDERGTHENLSVWNPVTRKIKLIEPLVSYSQTDYFGIGYDNTCRRNYKILRFSGPVSYADPVEFEIYEIKSDSWRSLDAKLDLVIDTDCKGVSVKGNMYWVTEAEVSILSFDFTMETFKNVCVCPCYRETRRLGCFNGDRLSLLLQDIQHVDEEVSTEIDVWVTNKLSDGVVSFTKYFNITSPHLPLLWDHTDMARPGYSIGNNRNIMAWCEAERCFKENDDDDDKCYTCITLYQIDQGGIRKQIETGRHRTHHYFDPYICSYVYVPSLIPVPD